MSDRARVDIRIRLVEGHWALGEYGEAQTTLERALDEDPSHPGLRPLVVRLQGAVDSGHAPSELREALAHLAQLFGGADPAGTRGEGDFLRIEQPDPLPGEPVREECELEEPDPFAAEPVGEGETAGSSPIGAESSEWEEDELERPSPLATSTMAELFFEQGLHDEAMRVAEDVLRRNPGDQRARRLLSRLLGPSQAPDPRIAVLQRWLSRVRRRRAEGGLHP